MFSIGGSKNKSKQSSNQTTSQTATSTLTDQSRNLLAQRMAEIQGQEYTAFDPSQIDQYLNPNTQAVIDATSADIDVSRGEEANAQRQAMLARGALGSSDRRGVREAELTGRYDRTKATTIAGLRQRAYEQATGVAQGENTNKNTFSANVQAQINQLLSLLANDRVTTSNGTASGSATGSQSGLNFGFSK